MKKTVLCTSFWFVLALLFTAMYASVEGDKPFAQNLATWRPDPNLWWVQVLYWFPNLGRPVNGFDTLGLLLLGAFGIFLIPVWGVTHGRPIPWREWFEIFTYFIAISVIEDWVWYLVNPHFGIWKFRPALITDWMHPVWFFGIVPSQYVSGCLGSLPIAMIAQNSAKDGLKFWATIWATMVVLSLATGVVAQIWWIR